LDDSDLFGLDDSNYEIHQDKSEIDENFKKLAPKILELKPKDVKEFGILRQILWNVKITSKLIDSTKFYNLQMCQFDISKMMNHE
jgi:hypothetical protein